jgi:hypothetical protein
MTEFTLCTVCGVPIANHAADLQFGVPDSVLAAPDIAIGQGAWMSGQSPADSDLLILPPMGAFARCLLPVRVDGGAILTYGVWVRVDDVQFYRLREVWNSEQYGGLTISGTLANKLPFEHAILSEVVAKVADSRRRPVIVSSSDSWTRELLGAVLPHEFIEQS